MRQFAFRFFTVGMLGACIALAGSTVLHAQQTQGEIIRPKEMKLTLDKELGVPAVHIGQGKLHQVDVTLVEIPPGRKLAPVPSKNSSDLK